MHIYIGFRLCLSTSSKVCICMDRVINDQVNHLISLLSNNNEIKLQLLHALNIYIFFGLISINTSVFTGGTSASALYEAEKGGLRTVISDSVWAAYRCVRGEQRRMLELDEMLGSKYSEMFA